MSKCECCMSSLPGKNNHGSAAQLDFVGCSVLCTNTGFIKRTGKVDADLWWIFGHVPGRHAGLRLTGTGNKQGTGEAREYHTGRAHIYNNGWTFNSMAFCNADGQLGAEKPYSTMASSGYDFMGISGSRECI